MTGPAGVSADFFDAVRGGIVVSCQASAGHPFRDSSTIALLARCAELGGAVGLRIDSPADIEAVRRVSVLPILGLSKVPRSGGLRPLITTTVQACRDLAAAGAAAIALEVADDPERTVGEALAVVRAASDAVRVPLVADVATLEAGHAAVAAGATAVASTLAGYTPETRGRTLPDLDLVASLAGLGVPVIAEGGYARPDEVAEAFRRGAWAVVVGTAITDPVAITTRFVGAAVRGADG